jgi:cytochrome c oxidase assembly protein subunit 15
MDDALLRSRMRSWLFACAGLVTAVLLVGGATRLTQSGLSIATWQPLVGVVPPLSESAWSEAFAQYRATPEFQIVNPGMGLAGFRTIFWWEYAHRLLARAAGLAYVLPLLWFLRTAARRDAVRRVLPGGRIRRLGVILALGGAQGVAGWLMVASGLVSEPRVSPLRLAVHLGLALLLMALMFWTAWDLRTFGVKPMHVDGGRRFAPVFAWGAVTIVFAMALSGALVAGTHAGHVFNTLPTMNGALIPDGMWILDPWYENLLFNLLTVQFTHRALACVVVVAVSVLAWFAHAQPTARPASRRVLGLLAVQLLLGIATLLSAAWLPLALAHQAGAVLLWIGVLWAARQAGGGQRF